MVYVSFISTLYAVIRPSHTATGFNFKFKLEVNFVENNKPGAQNSSCPLKLDMEVVNQSLPGYPGEAE